MLLNPFFGKFGGQFVPELLIPALDQLEKAFVETKDDPSFQAELNGLLTTYAGRPTPITLCRNLTKGAPRPSSISSEKTSCTAAHTKRIKCSAKHFWQNGWAKRASLRKQAQASTA